VQLKDCVRGSVFHSCCGRSSRNAMCVYNRDDSEDEQLAFKDEPLAPALRKRPGRHKASQGPDHMTEKRALLNFVPCFGRGTIQCRRYINFHRLASRSKRCARHQLATATVVSTTMNSPAPSRPPSLGHLRSDFVAKSSLAAIPFLLVTTALSASADTCSI
jgi:hypothetical protein